MTTTAPPLNGQDINLAARATRLVLVDALQPLDTSFEEWVTINLVATGQADTATAVQRRLAAGLGLATEAVDAVLDELVVSVVLERHGDRLSLTDEGRRRWDAGQAIVAEIVRDLYDGIDPEDLAATRRVLVEVTGRAEARLGR